MKSAQRDWSLLQQSLQQDTETSQQLLQLMRDERKALESRNYGAFEALLQPKQTLIAKLEQHAQQRHEWMVQQRFASDSAALSQAHEEAPHIAAQWQNAADIWRECQTQNQINEQICRRTRTVVEQVLDALRGQHQHSVVYDAKGLAQRGASGRTISNA